MRNFFTNSFLLVFFVLVTQNIFGQINILKITEPIGIAGEYNIQRFPWGPIKSTSLKGLSAFGDDGVDPKADACTDLVNDMTGKIAFIDRGTCGLIDKLLAVSCKVIRPLSMTYPR